MIPKYCRTCQKEKTNFGRRKGTKDGLDWTCKDCKSTQQKIYRSKKGNSYMEPTKRWRSLNKENERKTKKEWYLKNRDQELQRAKNWHRNNSVKSRQLHKEWRENNRDKVRLQNQTRRSRRHNAAGLCTLEQLRARIDFYGGKCAYCRINLYSDIDHVIPLSKGGSNWPANLRPSCQTCNSSKNDKDLKSWLGV